MIHRIKNMMLKLIPECLAIRPVWVTLDSGLKVCIDSKLSLDCFIELFLTQTYVPALNILPEYNVVVDLGANRGFFLLFVFHHLQKQGAAKPQLFCVEAAKPNFRRLKRHVAANSLTERVMPINGAVCGQRSGVVNFYYAHRAHGMGCVVNKRKLTTRRVPVVDVAKFVTAPKIDLLKLDIEGGEEAFLQEYSEVLEKSQVLITEFHLQDVDHRRCQALLAESGLMFHSRSSQFEDKSCVEIYTR